MNSYEVCYNYICWKLGVDCLDSNDISYLEYNACINYTFYDIITVEFINSHTNNTHNYTNTQTHTNTHNYILKPYDTKIKIYDYDYGAERYLIEKKYLSSPELKSSPYVLVKLSNGKYGYLHTENFDPIEFESQDLIKNKLLDFLLNNVTL